MTKETIWDVMLIAPVGTRDVTLTDLSLLPNDELREAWNHADSNLRTGAWQKGEVLLADLDRYLPALRFEILGKAVRHVFDRHKRIDRLVLVASKQGDDVPERYRKNDTCNLALVVKEYLKQDKELHQVGERVKIMIVTGNPANYDGMRSFYRENLPGWIRNLSPEGTCYLEVTGGTAQMSTMLLLEGVSLLRARAVPLYVLEELGIPQTLDVGRAMLVDSLQQTLQRDLEVYAYHAALKSVTAEERVLRPRMRYYDALRATLDAARHRLNLNLDAAQKALFGADQGLPDPLAQHVLRLASELGPPSRTLPWRIAEVYHTAVIRRRTEAYASFLGRIFRFQEALLRYLCEVWGAQFSGENDAFIDRTWLTNHPDVADRLSRANVDLQKTVTRYSLDVLARYLAQSAENQTGLSWLKQLDRFDELSKLRNQSVVAHGFAGISADLLAKKYSGGAEQIEKDMAGLLHEVLDVDASTNPYDEINDLCLKLAKGI